MAEGGEGGEEGGVVEEDEVAEVGVEEGEGVVEFFGGGGGGVGGEGEGGELGRGEGGGEEGGEEGVDGEGVEWGMLLLLGEWIGGGRRWGCGGGGVVFEGGEVVEWGRRRWRSLDHWRSHCLSSLSLSVNENFGTATRRNQILVPKV